MLNGSREFCQEFLTDVIVPDTDRVGDVDDGWTVGIRWMFHERMLYTSPYVTHPVGSAPSRMYSSTVHAIAQEAGRMDDPSVRDLVGEARMLELVSEEMSARVAERMTRGQLSDQAAALVRLGKALAQTRISTLALEVADSAGAAWTEDSCRGAQRRQLPDAPGRQHRWRHGGDGAQRGQRAGAVHAARAHTGQGPPVPRSAAEPVTAVVDGAPGDEGSSAWQWRR